MKLKLTYFIEDFKKSGVNAIQFPSKILNA